MPLLHEIQTTQTMLPGIRFIGCYKMTAGTYYPVDPNTVYLGFLECIPKSHKIILPTFLSYTAVLPLTPMEKRSILKIYEFHDFPYFCSIHYKGEGFILCFQDPTT